MLNDTAKLDVPIQIMAMIHKALSAEAVRVQQIIEDFQEGDSLQNFRAAFNFWATALKYHADVEDRHMTLPLADFEPARANEAEHAQLGELADDMVRYLDDRNEQDWSGGSRPRPSPSTRSSTRSSLRSWRTYSTF